MLRFATPLLLALLFYSCKTVEDPFDKLEILKIPVSVSGIVVNLERSEAAPFRHFGTFKFLQPVEYEGVHAELFILNTERSDLSSLIQTEINILGDALYLELRIKQVSIWNEGVPSIGLVYQSGKFSTFNSDSFEGRIPASGRIKRIIPKSKDYLYFIYNMASHGDLVEVEITEPAAYRGGSVHILIADSSIESPLWLKVGAMPSFIVQESALAWEPWGHTLIGEIDSVRFLKQ